MGLRERWAKWRRWLLRGFLGSLIGFVVMVVGVLVYVYAVPFPVEVLDLDRFGSVRVVDRRGGLLREWLSEGRGGRAQWRRLEEVSPWFTKAMLAAEDFRFYDHWGVDGRALARAVRDNLGAGRVVSGASTITMQVIRLLWPGERSWGKKASEAVWALRLERALTKEEILEQYINRAPFGNELYGVEAAAQRYFGKSAQEMSPAQAAFLAALPQSPVQHNPLRHPERAKKRQRWILGQMHARGVLDAVQLAQALDEPLLLKTSEQAFAAPHFMDFVRQGLSAEVLEKAKTIQTTLDPEIQGLVEGVVRGHIAALRDKNVTQAAVVVLDTQTAEILAMVGSRDFFDEEHDGQVNAAVALRQPGSALKPFTFALAFERGWTAATLIADIATTYSTERGSYTPINFDKMFRGPVRARPALGSSLNIPAIKALDFIGVETLLRWLRETGFEELTQEPEFYGLALTLGAGEVRLLDLAAAFGVFGRGGVWIEASGIKEMRDANGEVIEKASPATRQALKPETAALIADILSDPVARAAAFGMAGPLNLPFKVAAKTGTSSDFRDIWTVGLTPRYLVAVWVGNFDNQSMSNVSGIAGAAPIFRDIMLNLHPLDKPLPEWPTTPKLEEVRVCALSGQLATPNCPEQLKERFAPDTAPDKLCPFHKRVRLDRRDGLIIPEGCEPADIPASEIEERVFAYLPPEYDAWLAQTDQKFPPTAISPRCGAPAAGGETENRQAVRILKPAASATFQIDPSLPRDQQQVRFEVVAPADATAVRWLLNGDVLAEAARPFHARWRLEQGTWQVEAVALRGTEVVGRHQIQVVVLP